MNFETEMPVFVKNWAWHRCFLKIGNLFANGTAVYEMSSDWKDGTEEYKLVLG